MSEITAEQLRKLATYSGEPWTPDSPYFPDAEASMEPLWNGLVWPFIEGCDFSHTIDLAAGHGRNSAILSTLAERLTIMDIQAGNVEVCKQRLSGRKGIEFFVNNGFDFQPVRDADATLVYCFDAMVHFDSDVVRSYLCDTRRVLSPRGRGFFHHSNYTGGHDWQTNLGGRNFMTKEMFAHYALKEGLNVLSQRVIDWSGESNIDCLTLVERTD
ncbi:MAG TPA: class I SAM-dependent methyltransferase [Candidatus Sulfotelmatobacter sp.]|nr:class I SAM-dependent methyltransferase [Candidatus Sulfotelmatobacter sp.]